MDALHSTDQDRLDLATDATWEAEGLIDMGLRMIAEKGEPTLTTLYALRGLLVRLHQLNSTVMSALNDDCVTTHDLAHALDGVAGAAPEAH